MWDIGNGFLADDLWHYKSQVRSLITSSIDLFRIDQETHKALCLVLSIIYEGPSLDISARRVSLALVWEPWAMCFVIPNLSIDTQDLVLFYLYRFQIIDENWWIY